MKIGLDPMIVAVTLEQTIKALVREKIPANELSDNSIKEIFRFLHKGKIAKEAVDILVRYLAENPKEELEKSIKSLGLESLTKEALAKIIDDILAQNVEVMKSAGSRAMGKIMGEVMKKVRGKIDGKIVNDCVKVQFNEKLKLLEENNA